MFLDRGFYGHGQHRDEAAIARGNGNWAEQCETVKALQEEAARRLFWFWQGLPQMEAFDAAREIVMPTEVMAREAEIYDPAATKVQRARALVERLRAALAAK